MVQSLVDFARGKLAALEQQQLRRVLVDTERLEGAVAIRNGRQLVSFACNDYLNLSQHPVVKQAASEAIERYGVGSGASRLVTGNHPLFRELEMRLAALKGTDDACVFGSGYLANLGIIPALIGPGDLLLADELSHACLLAAGHAHAAPFPAKNTTRREDYERLVVGGGGINSIWCASRSSANKPHPFALACHRSLPAAPIPRAQC